MSAGRMSPEDARREFYRLRDMYMKELEARLQAWEGEGPLPSGLRPATFPHGGRLLEAKNREARQMRFAELKAVFAGWRVRMIVLAGDGETRSEEISLLDTVGAYDKLARYDEAEVVRFTTGTMEHDGQEYPALEVTVRV